MGDDTHPTDMNLSVGDALTIHVIGATSRHLAKLARDLGAENSTPSSSPDVTVRFVDAIAAPGLVRLDLVDCASSGAGFHIVDPISREPVATVPFGDLGRQFEVVYKRGAGSMPLISELLRIALLQKRHVTLQAAAFEYNGKGVLVFGWPKSGKTGVLLGAALDGASVLGDEWISLSPRPTVMFPFAPTVTISDWQYPAMRQVVGSKPVRFRVVRTVERLYRRGLLPRHKLVDVGLPRLVRTLNRTVPAESIGRSTSRSTLSAVFVLERDDSSPSEHRQISTEEAVWRARAVNAFEWQPFRSKYQAWKFANPGHVDEAVEAILTEEAARLHEAFRNMPAVLVRHRYPGPVSRLFQPFKAQLGP